MPNKQTESERAAMLAEAKRVRDARRVAQADERLSRLEASQQQPEEENFDHLFPSGDRVGLGSPDEGPAVDEEYAHLFPPEREE